MGCFAIFFPPVISTMPFNLCIESLKCSIARNLVKMGMHRLACVGVVWCADENWWVNWNWINHASNFVHGVFAIIFVIVVAIYMRPGMWQMYCTTVRNGLHEMCAISLETGDTVQISRDKYAEVVDYLKWDSAAVTSTAPPPSVADTSFLHQSFSKNALSAWNQVARGVCGVDILLLHMRSMCVHLVCGKIEERANNCRLMTQPSIESSSYQKWRTILATTSICVICVVFAEHWLNKSVVLHNFWFDTI